MVGSWSTMVNNYFKLVNKPLNFMTGSCLVVTDDGLVKSSWVMDLVMG